MPPDSRFCLDGAAAAGTITLDFDAAAATRDLSER
jgi:hypothetical protein